MQTASQFAKDYLIGLKSVLDRLPLDVLEKLFSVIASRFTAWQSPHIDANCDPCPLVERAGLRVIYKDFYTIYIHSKQTQEYANEELNSGSLSY